MSLLPFTLILISVLSHAYWNFLVKQSNEKELFVALSKIVEVVIFFIPFLILIYHFGLNLAFWYYILGASIFVFLNYYFLAKAYKNLDLSVAYPISRSSTIFIPFIAFIFIGEVIDIIGIIAVLIVTLGIFTINKNDKGIEGEKFSLKLFINPSIVHALLAAFTVASYTVWDKVAIRKIHPFLYFYLYSLLVALFYGLIIYFKYGCNVIRESWHNSKRNIIQVGFFNTFTYILVLTALQYSKATYIGALRQLSLIVSVVIGYKYLNESVTFTKILGISLILGGGILTLFAQ